jgi:ABC-2 type transport system ATP-binding protein
LICYKDRVTQTTELLREDAERDGRAAALVTDGLSKRYGRRLAVDALTIEVPAGVVAGFIGPNGAGKTTTMAMLLGLVRPSAGTATVLGASIQDPASYLHRVGSLIEAPSFWPGLTGVQNLQALAVLGGHDKSRIPEVLALVGLDTRGSDRFGEYSFGMKQRLGIAAALLGDPALLVLDEPTNGLDPAGINEMRDFIRSVGDGRRTVLVSSHILSELEQVCDWLIVIDRGSLVYQGPTQGFLGRAGTVVALAPEHVDDLGRLAELARADGLEPRSEGDELIVPVRGDDPRQVALALNKAAIAQDIVLAELHVRRPSLESNYLAAVEERGR